MGRDAEWAAAVRAWRSLLGAAHVVTAAEGRERAVRGTFPGGAGARCVLLPGHRDEVAACLRIAHRRRLPVHPVSTGRNWGYGSVGPGPREVAVLRLSRLDGVLDLDEALGTVTVQPGVTFGSLARHLAGAGSRRWPPATGAGPDTSVVGNVLQRGLGSGAYRDMAAQVRALELVLPDGTPVRTRAPGATADCAEEGPGPSVNGLFLQGGPAVVTSLTLALHPAPERHQRVLFRLRDGCLAAVLDAARELLQRVPAGLTLDVRNRPRITAQWPADPAAAPPPLPAALDGAWTGCAELWADSTGLLDATRDRVLARMSAYAEHWHLQAPAPGAPPAGGSRGLACAYRHKPARTPDGLPPDPGRDRCGVLWFAPALPMRGADAARVVDAVERAMTAHGIEPCVALRLGARVLHCVAGLFWDRDDTAAESRALACHRRLAADCARLGAYPYRPLLARVPEQAVDASVRELLARLWGAVDPRGVLSPPHGRPVP
ncbi:FAD-binding oxidoreductase [Streptomyces sp. NPDC127106]|uniref:FAD-binding oxidoreductase n=1 Tax=Streptomyces sp. NPDC127106 TaxID=3345360 RepID=UPI00363141CC